MNKQLRRCEDCCRIKPCLIEGGNLYLCDNCRELRAMIPGGYNTLVKPPDYDGFFTVARHIGRRAAERFNRKLLRLLLDKPYKAE